MNKRDKIIVVAASEKPSSDIGEILGADYAVSVVCSSDLPSCLAAIDAETMLVVTEACVPAATVIELITGMQNHAHQAGIPVLVTTDSEDPAFEADVLSAGASDCMRLPVIANVLRARVANGIRFRVLGTPEFDSLTGVMTREFFYHRFSEYLRHNAGVRLDLVSADVEGFRDINDKYGTAVGDLVLRFLATHFSSVSECPWLCGRIGSNSFVFVLRHEETDDLAAFSERMKTLLKDAPVSRLTMKYGVYEVDDPEGEVAAMCDATTLAVRRIKQHYGTDVVRYDESMRQTVIRERTLLDAMEQGLEEHQFTVHFHPKHDLRSGSVIGAEALVRWNHPTLGLVMPGEFIPLFERNGFITELDFYVWEETCKAIAKWHHREEFDFPVSVNVSRVDFERPDLVDIIENLITKYDLPPEVLHLEITESAYARNPAQILSALKTLRDLGFKIEMDDFGSGYSSLNTLSDMQVDYLKLDMRFIQEHDNMPNNRKILSFIISLSKWLTLPTIAEGVETEEDEQLLKSMGCNYAQGFLYAKPMPAGEFETYVPLHRNKSIQIPEPQPGFVRPAFDSEHTILVVEDVAVSRAMLEDMLKPYYTVLTAANGAEALEVLKKNKISAMLLDLMMPVMDGFQLLDIMRADNKLSSVPVIITSEAGTDAELRALRLGAQGFLPKPYHPEILLHHVQTVLDQLELRAIKQQQAECQLQQ